LFTGDARQRRLIGYQQNLAASEMDRQLKLLNLLKSPLDWAARWVTQVRRKHWHSKSRRFDSSTSSPNFF
jgi:hypothetical protein